jgi:hypothetical protein
MTGDPIVAPGMHVHAPAGAGYPVSDSLPAAADKRLSRSGLRVAGCQIVIDRFAARREPFSIS